MTDSVLTTILDEVIKFVVEHGFPAAIGLVAGGTGGAALTNFFRTNSLGNTDFKIVEESTKVVLQPAPAAGSLLVNVHRQFKLKLRNKSKQGTYRFRSELNGNSILGKWLPGCQIILNDAGLRLNYEEENSIIVSDACHVSARDTLTVTLHSTETIAKGRGCYALVVSNPKERTTMQWRLEDFHDSAPKVRAFASSDDFDLLILRCGVAELVHESSHQVTYFFLWAKELPG
jgi:hypothetical protein